MPDNATRYPPTQAGRGPRYKALCGSLIWEPRKSTRDKQRVDCPRCMDLLREQRTYRPNLIATRQGFLLQKIQGASHIYVAISKGYADFEDDEPVDVALNYGLPDRSIVIGVAHIADAEQAVNLADDFTMNHLDELHDSGRFDDSELRYTTFEVQYDITWAEIRGLIDSSGVASAHVKAEGDW